MIFNEVGRGNTDIAVLKHEMAGARADIISIKATQSDHGELLREHTKRFDRIETTMATKDDIAAMKVDIAAIKDDISRLEGLMIKILDRLPKPEGE